MKNIAIIGPRFFGYCEAIVEEIKSRGIISTFYDELFSNSKTIKILIRFGLGFLFYPLKQRYYNKILEEIRRNGVTDVLLISVEYADLKFVKQLAEFEIKTHLYMWDGLDRKKNCRKLILEIAQFATFDPVDANKYNVDLIHLFAEKYYSNNTIEFSKRNNSIVFAGTLHSHRPLIISKIIKVLKNKKIRLDGLFYYPSKILYLMKCIVQPAAYDLYSNISSDFYAKNMIGILFGRSKFVLDIPFPTQNGLTSRTFEALMAGAVLVTTNKFVNLLPHSFIERTIVFNDITDAFDVKLNMSMSPDELSEDQKYYLSIERFIDEILRYMSKN